MTKHLPNTVLWSDMDGTIVQTIFHYNPRNWFKLWPTGKAGYREFLTALDSKGIEIAGLVSRRPNFWIIRWMTQKSIKRLKLTNFFKTDRIILSGSDEVKGGFVAKQSLSNPVIMVEDKPYKIGPVIVARLRSKYRYPVTLAVVPHPRAKRYIRRLHSKLSGIPDINLLTSTHGDLKVYDKTNKTLLMRVILLDPYSSKSGQKLAKQLL